MDFMPVVELIRLEENYEHGTFGILKINKEVFCFTLEPRDEENKRDISSIPAQQYICEIRATGLSSIMRLGFAKTFEVLNVPGRTNIKIHPGNFDEDTEGCILLGSSVGKLRKGRAILNSGNTWKAFMNRMDGINEFHLTIREVY